LRGVYVAGTYGASIRHAIGLRVLGPLTHEYGGSAFPKPPANLLSGVTLEIPNVVGKTPEDAKALLESLGFIYANGGPKPSDAPIGTVAYSDPPAGTKVSKGYQITVYTSDGSLYVEMPDDLIGKSLHDAVDELVGVGFSGGNITVQWEAVANPGDPMCEVTGTNPAPGAGTSKQAAVTLTVSAMPDGSPPPGCHP
jgi:beta-lactam-binding protein with PASTA domain